MTTDRDERARARARVLTARLAASYARDDEPQGRAEQLGLVLPELHCSGCTNRIVSLICWDAERGMLTCIRCAATLHRLDPGADRFFTLSIEARDSIPGMGWLPLAQAREILMRFGAREL